MFCEYSAGWQNECRCTGNPLPGETLCEFHLDGAWDEPGREEPKFVTPDGKLVRIDNDNPGEYEVWYKGWVQLN